MLLKMVTWITLVRRAWRQRPRAHPLHPIYRREGSAAGPITDAAIVEMVRGWAPLSANWIDAAGVARATRLAITYINSFPDGYRARTAPEEGAADILRLAGLRMRTTGRCVFRASIRTRRDTCGSRPIVAADSFRRRTSSRSENFGFRVLEEFPTALSGGNGYIHDFRVEVGAEAEMDQIVARTDEVGAR
jgi:glutamate dehydrogenase